MATPPGGQGEAKPAGESRHDLATRRAPASKTARWLEQQGGFVLILAGAGLIALAAILAERPAVAPLFTIFGATMVILGCFYSRIEGAVEASKDGVRMVVREVERLADREGLPAEVVPNLIEEAIERYEPPSRRPQEVRRAARDVAEQVVSGAGYRHEQELVLAFGVWLERQGWNVELSNLRAGRELDLLATKAEETLAVEVKNYRRPVGQEVIQQVAGLRMLLGRPSVRVALVVRAESGITRAASEAASRLGVEVYAVQDDGDVAVLVNRTI